MDMQPTIRSILCLNHTQKSESPITHIMDIGSFQSSPEFQFSKLSIRAHYYTTQAVREPITKINQSKCSIAGPIFSKYCTGHCPE